MRKALATVLYIFLGLPLALSALMLLSVRPWALDRQTYKRFVLDDRLYSALKAPEIAERAEKIIRLDGMSLNGPALISAAQKNLPVDAIKTTGESVIDQVMDRALVISNSPVSINLTTLKSAFRYASPSTARDYVAALPVENRAPSFDDLSFRSSSVSEKTAASAVSKLLTKAVDTGIPDTTVLEAPLVPSTPPAVPVGRERSISQALLNRTSIVTTFFASILLAGLGILGGAGWGARMARTGRYVIIPSIFVLGVGALIAVPGGMILQNLLPAEVLGFVKGEAGAQLRAYLASCLGPIARSFFITGIIGASLGGLLISLRRIAEPKEIE
jgi:hypothetical protein